jgi:hypothetical protein
MGSVRTSAISCRVLADFYSISSRFQDAPIDVPERFEHPDLVLFPLIPHRRCDMKTSQAGWIRTAVLGSLLVLLCTTAQALPLTRPGPDAAQLVGFPGYPANELYEVTFIMIDGQNLVGDRDVLWLEPGRYEVTVRSKVRRPPGLSWRNPRLRRDTDYNTIEIVAEAGKTYQILQQYIDDREPTRYITVLHRVYDTP